MLIFSSHEDLKKMVASKVPDDLKQELRQFDKWKKYTTLYFEKKSKGLSGPKARLMTVKELIAEIKQESLFEELDKANESPKEDEPVEPGKKSKAKTRNIHVEEPIVSTDKGEYPVINTPDKIEQFTDKLRAKREAEKKAMMRSKDEFTERPSTPLNDVDWIYHNINTKGIKPSDAPSSGAYYHLLEIQSDPSNKSEFYKMYMSRRLPSRSEIEGMEAQFNDDGSDLSNFIDTVIDKSLEV